MSKFIDRPRYLCALGGAIGTLGALNGVIPILHAAAGCGGNIANALNGGAGYLGSGYCAGQAYVRFIGTKSHSDNYKDGDGNEVHSFYDRSSLTGIFGWKPDSNTLLELSLDSSKAKAAYADRTMDGSKFDRTGYNLKLKKENLSSTVKNLEANLYRNYIDHVMDNYSLRQTGGMKMAGNPDRLTIGGKLTADLELSSKTSMQVGLDYLRNKHTSRSGDSQVNYWEKPRLPDMTFNNLGLFAELTYKANENSRWLGGLRVDYLNVENERQGQQAKDSSTSYGGFLRYEQERGPWTTYSALGHAQRPADWWERNRVFFLKPEKNTQFDTGFIYERDKIRLSSSLFYSQINDFILITNNSPRARNIEATLYGGEGELAYSLSKNWSAAAGISSVYGRNRSDDKPLAQIPPLEGTLSLKYSDEKWGAQVLWRGVQAQNRFDLGSGSIAGTDIGPSDAFSLVSVNLSYRPNKDLVWAAGVDNIFNATYAEFVSKATSSSMAALGLPVTTRVNEPGRNFWLKASYSF